MYPTAMQVLFVLEISSHTDWVHRNTPKNPKIVEGKHGSRGFNKNLSSGVFSQSRSGVWGPPQRGGGGGGGCGGGGGHGRQRNLAI